MNCKQLVKLMIALPIVLPCVMRALHYEMVKVDGKQAILVWENSVSLDHSAPVIMPEDSLVPFYRVNSGSWRPSMKNDTAFWNNLGKQLLGRDCKIEPVPHTQSIKLIQDESSPLFNTVNSDKSLQSKRPAIRTYKSERLNINPLTAIPDQPKDENKHLQKEGAQTVWQKYYIFPIDSYDQGVFETYDMGYMIGGSLRKQNSPSFGHVVKTDINGNKLWQKVIGGQKESSFTSVNITSDGGFIAGGYYNTHDYKKEAYVMKFNACGEPEWCTILPNNTKFNSIVNKYIHQTPDGNFFLSIYLEAGGNGYSNSLAKLRPMDPWPG